MIDTLLMLFLMAAVFGAMAALDGGDDGYDD